MKTKIFLIIIVLFSTSCQSQVQIPEDNITITEYPNFYNQTVTKLNNIIPNKTNYYGQPLSVFLNTLTQNNVIIKSYDPGPYDNHQLLLSFMWNWEVRNEMDNNNYVEPYVQIYFQQPFNYQQAVSIMGNGYHSYWNPEAKDFYKDLIISKIEFWNADGINVHSLSPQ